MNIPIEQMPDSADEEVKAWADRLMTSLSVAFEEQQSVIESLEARVAKLENP
ncbi:hypothetical protein S1R3Y_000042 [Vibrio phage vB_ValP_VA-RY-3]|nr:hypothetical protein S1R3Y_000042 [Vibrio phage vB_ValP_VA-RY-3]